MDELPDVLDHLGKTPREFGAIHAHFEEVVVDPGGRAEAVLLFQLAFAPMRAGAKVSFWAPMPGEIDRAVGQFPVPELGDGRAVRVRFPLEVGAGATTVLARFECTPEPKAERVRPAWKLFDTIEIPKESEMKAADSAAEIHWGESLFHSVLTGAPTISFSVNTASAATRTVVHKAPAGPIGLSAQCREGIVQATEVVIETLWRPGEPLPEPAPAQVIAPVAPTVSAAPARPRHCFACGFEDERGRYRDERRCPNCDNDWS
jgi:hypothetical protein